MSEVHWVQRATILAIHDEQISEHGGAVGIPDGGLLDSAIARPRNLAAYGAPDLIGLAACYAFGLVRNHPFVDGNKRTAYVAMETFLELNGCSLEASDAESISTMLRLAAGELSEAELAAWLRANSAPA